MVVLLLLLLVPNEMESPPLFSCSAARSHVMLLATGFRAGRWASINHVQRKGTTRERERHAPGPCYIPNYTVRLSLFLQTFPAKPLQQNKTSHPKLLLWWIRPAATRHRVRAQ
uniref:Putative secreted protein n=1 Tax=Anopheles marajoara TaxID=58244 RepID=A0A2M4C825_9DIPT